MPRHLAAIGATTLALVLVTPAAAHADRWASPDPTGDVVGWHYDPEPAPCGTDTEVDGSGETNEDLTRLSVRHTRRNVVVTTTYRDLDPDKEQLVSLYLRGSTGAWWLDLDRYEARPGRWRTLAFLAEEPDYPDPDEIGECGFIGIWLAGEPCRMSRSFAFDKEQVVITVPRSCLGDPRWVRAGASSYGFVEPADPSDRTSTGFYDDWDAGTVLSEWGTPYGPRVRATRGAVVGQRAGDRSRAGTGERRFVVRYAGGEIARR